MYMMNDREFSNRKETLHGEFYENALKYPERIALIYENEKVSYKMLRLYALRAANYMWQRGVRRNDKIVVILPRGIGQVAALLGILAIGAAYVPIAMKQPLGRRKKIIENVKPALVLQDEAFLEENPWTGCIENNSKDTAYIIYTSGSSGEPKGVEMSHVAAMNTIEEILHMWNIGAEDSVLNISAFDFDLSVFDIFGLLTVGGTIVLIDEDDFRDPEVWKNLIEIYGITIWNSAPALLDMFLIMGENNHFGKLRLALVSGDWIPLYLPEKWYKVTSANSQFVALGGATEGGIWSNYYCVSKVDRLWNSIPYGQALPKQKYRITDENFVECGVDIPGELQIGGGSLAKGYINDEELTMKKFITDVKGERWYRTGDRGRRWADGTIEFLGRMDTQVKIRGHRIELGEIESVLKSISRIKEAVVVAQGDKYHKELVAFYLGEYIAESEIEDYLKIHLPEYSIPNSINRLENFPLNANGKVDRRRLAEYQKTDSVEIMSDKVLNIVLMIWEELLKNKVADLDENLFKIGADSLLAARFVAAINARCGIEVSRAWKVLVNRHEMLRAKVTEVGFEILERDEIDYEIKIVNLQKMAEREKVDTLSKIREDFSEYVFHTEEPPLFKVLITKRIEGNFFHLLVDLIVSDFASVQLLISEMGELLKGASLEKIRYKFSDYAMFNQQRKGSLKWHQDRMYWLERLKKLPEAPILPQDGRAADKCENTYEFYRFQKHINQSDWKRIKEIAGEYGVTVSSVLIGIYAEVISRWSSNKHFTLNLPIQNRPTIGNNTNSIVGDFTAVNLLEVNVTQNMSFIERVKEITKRLMEDLEHNSFSGVEVLRELSKVSEEKELLMPIVFTGVLKTDGTVGTIEYGFSHTPQVWIDCQIVDEIDSEDQEKGLMISWDTRKGAIKESIVTEMFESFTETIRILGIKHSEEWKNPLEIIVPSASKKKVICERNKGITNQSRIQQRFVKYEVEIVNCIRESGSAAFMLNPFYRYIKPIRDFLEAAQIISKHAHLINASLECAIHVLYDGIDILGCALGGLSTWKLGNVAESYTTSMAGGGNRVISGIIGMVPVTFIVNTNVDRNDIDHPLHLYHRIELTFSTGRLCLVNTHGPVIWLPFLHMPRDEYGTLSINVEEEVNIPSGVTIGNVMLPSVKETFEQIWPDAVKKALEILFKQNRTEKMSMAQYQIYVSKLWSEICQKVGYMNIVDYDNFGDIKSIFYDLEKRHLIKKENDGIE